MPPPMAPVMAPMATALSTPATNCGCSRGCWQQPASRSDRAHGSADENTGSNRPCRSHPRPWPRRRSNNHRNHDHDHDDDQQNRHEPLQAGSCDAASSAFCMIAQIDALLALAQVLFEAARCFIRVISACLVVVSQLVRIPSSACRKAALAAVELCCTCRVKPARCSAKLSTPAMALMEAVKPPHADCHGGLVVALRDDSRRIDPCCWATASCSSDKPRPPSMVACSNPTVAPNRCITSATHCQCRWAGRCSRTRFERQQRPWAATAAPATLRCRIAAAWAICSYQHLLHVRRIVHAVSAGHALCWSS